MVYVWIEETKNGKFKAVERYEDYLTGKQKKVSVTIEKNTAQSRKLAQAALNEKIKERQLITVPVQKQELTLKELIKEYRKDQEDSVRKSTYKRNYHSCNTFMKMFGEDTLVNRMTAKFVRDSLKATGKSPGTMNEHITRFKALIRWGYKNDLVSDISFLDKIESFKDKPHKEKIEDKYLEVSEIKIVLKNMHIKKWRDFTEFMILSGLRPGEAFALTPNDIDLKNRIISVNKTYDANNKIITPPKNSSSIREVYIQDELIGLCRELKKNALIYRLANGCDALFQDDYGRLEYYAFKKYLKKITLESIDHEITPHALRHTHASLLLEQGVSIDVISRRLGHENSKITREIYLHVTEKLKEKDNQTVAAIHIL
jgi:integrase